MAHINPIRIEIERICKCTFATSYVEKSSTKRHPTRYRLELSPFFTPGIPFERKLLDLPHVLKLDYEHDLKLIIIYFDCNPSQIKI